MSPLKRKAIKTSEERERLFERGLRIAARRQKKPEGKVCWWGEGKSRPSPREPEAMNSMIRAKKTEEGKGVRGKGGRFARRGCGLNAVSLRAAREKRRPALGDRTK